jgi:hypothetical protein
MSDEREKLSANTNEDAADDEVQAHSRAGQSENANEDVAEDEQARGKLASNANEDELADD